RLPSAERETTPVRRPRHASPAGYRDACTGRGREGGTSHAASVITMPQPWTTSATASVAGADGIVTLVEGSSFCISSRSGEIDPAHPQGLFFRDTRFVSELRLMLNGMAPEPLAATTTDPFSAVCV